MSELPDPNRLTVGDVAEALRFIDATWHQPYTTHYMTLINVLKASPDYEKLCDLCQATLGFDLRADSIKALISWLAMKLRQPFDVVRSIPLTDAVKMLDDDAAPAGPAALGGIGPPGRPARGRRRSNPVALGDRGPARSDRGGPDRAAGRRIGRLGEG
jgi:hypothetical protein